MFFFFRMNKLAILLGLFAAKEIIFLNLISRIELGSSNLKFKRSSLLWCEQKETFKRYFSHHGA